jgi:hypothetical protein
MGWVFFMFHVKFVHYMLKKTSVGHKAVDVSASSKMDSNGVSYL